MRKAACVLLWGVSGLRSRAVAGVCSTPSPRPPQTRPRRRRKAESGV